METVAIINQKGGVAKTTTAAALGAGLRQQGYRVLFVDLDPQSNLSTILRADTQQAAGSFEMLTKQCTAAQAIQTTPSGAVIAASGALAADGLLTTTGKEYRLKEVLQPLQAAFDYCIIDCPPSLGVLTVNALTAADKCIIPAQADLFSLQALTQFAKTFEAVQRYTNPNIKIDGVLVTRYSKQAILSRELLKALQETAAELGTQVYSTTIREGIAVKEAQAVQQDIFTYAPKSKPAADYKAFIKEFRDRGAAHNGKENI